MAYMTSARVDSAAKLCQSTADKSHTSLTSVTSQYKCYCLHACYFMLSYMLCVCGSEWLDKAQTFGGNFSVWCVDRERQKQDIFHDAQLISQTANL